MSDLNAVNILVTLDENYLPHLNVMLSTLVRFNPGCVFDVYLLHTSIGQGALNRVLYLDPDLVVNGSVASLYQMDLQSYYFAAASHTGAFLQKMNTLRLDMEEDSPYINSGVILMNLSLLRKEQMDVFYREAKDALMNSQHAL